jgi:hypothetical protein
MPGQVQDTLYQVSTATALVEGSTRAPGKSPLCGRTVIGRHSRNGKEREAILDDVTHVMLPASALGAERVVPIVSPLP